MRKKWNTFMMIFVLCLNPIAYGQEKIPESQAILIIEKMHELENRLRDHIDKKFAEQNKNITDLEKDVAVNSKQIELMTEDIKELQGTLTWIWRTVIIGGAGVILLNIVWYLIQHFVLKKPNNQKQDTSESAKDQEATAKYPDDTQTDLKEGMGEAA